jgi:hypothetical protein
MSAPSVSAAPNTEDTDPVRPDEARAALASICGSGAFSRSKRLQRFLIYVCELTLEGEANRINEYLIGSEVFARGPKYSPHEDSVVRRQAHSLRHKLGEYYASEGKNDSVRIELPIGHYVPEFHRQNPEGGAHDAGRAPAARGWERWVIAASIAAAVAVSFAAGRMTRGETRSPAGRTDETGIPSALAEIWRLWLDADDGPIVCFSNPLTAVVKHFDERLPADASPRRLPLGAGAEPEFRQFFGLPAGGFLYMTPSISQTKTGEAIGAVHLANLFARNGLRIRATQSRFLSWDDFRRENLILLGHDEANRWVDPVLEAYPLYLESTDGAQPRRIVDRESAGGQGKQYSIAYSREDDRSAVEYALVSMIPGVDRQHRLLVISGLNTQATQMAIEFLTNPPRVEDLAERLRAEVPDHEGPWDFQMVLRAEVRDKVPTGGSIETLRVLAGTKDAVSRNGAISPSRE